MKKDPIGAPDWEKMFSAKEDECRALACDLTQLREENKKLLEDNARCRAAGIENLKLRVIVGTIETMLGRKFDA